MKYELFIAKRLKLNVANGSKSATPSLNIAIIGMTLAIVVMILSIAIVCGFKKEITNKIYQLDSHIRVTNGAISFFNENITTVNSADIIPVLKSCNLDYLQDMSLIAEKPAIFKTDNDFKGIVYRGVDKNFNWNYFKDNLISGRIPCLADTAKTTEIIISKTTANQLNLQTGDRILTYFFDKSIKVRKLSIVGIYSTDFDEFDKNYIIGNIRQLQDINGWSNDEGNYVGINCSDNKRIGKYAYDIYSLMAQATLRDNLPTLYNVTNTQRTNMSFFAWLGLLDTNVIIIIILMALVSTFTLISGLLMIILERINMIGILKTLGAQNNSIRTIFIYLTQKLIIKSMIYGNIIGIATALCQKYFHFIKLNAESYYIPYVPIELNWSSLLILNLCIIVVSYVTLIGPSYLISKIKPNKSIRFE